MGTLKLNKKAINTVKETAEVVKESEIKQLNNIELEQVAQEPATTEVEVNELAKLDSGFVEEIKELRTENETVYRRNDRTFRKIITATPTRYRDDNGELKNINNTLTDNGKEIANGENSFKVKFNKDGHNGKIFDLQKGKNVLTLSSVTKARGHVCGCTCELCVGKENTVLATLDDGTEIQYETMADRIKENIIVKEHQDSYEYNFTLNIGDLSVEEGEHNDLLLKNKETGKTEFRIPAPFMYDANKVNSDKVAYEIDVNGEELAIKVVADAEFINAEGRAFPVIIDPQIVLFDGDAFSYMTTETSITNTENDEYPGEISIYEERSMSLYRQAEISINKRIFNVDSSIIKNVYLFLTAKPGAHGYFRVNGELNIAKAMTYKINITKLYKEGGYDPYINISGDVFTYGNEESEIEFYTTGLNVPRIEIEYLYYNNGKINSSIKTDYSSEDEKGNENNDKVIVPSVNPNKVFDAPNYKELEVCDKATSYVDLNDGTLITNLKVLNTKDFVIPLNVSLIHKLGLDETNFGSNWQLNLNKKLQVASDDSEKTTRFVYTNELGDKYIFEEKYYYISSGERVFIDKNNVNVNLNGELYFNNNPVYKYQSCNGYTLISEINDFKNSDFIEQKQERHIQLDEFVKQYKPVLKSYVKVDATTGEKLGGLNSLTKSGYENFIDGVNSKSNSILLTETEAAQFRSLFDSIRQIEVQKLQIDLQNRQIDLQDRQIKNQIVDLEYSRSIIKNSDPINYNKDMDFDFSKLDPTEKTERADKIEKLNLQNSYRIAERDLYLHTTIDSNNPHELLRSQAGLVVKQSELLDTQLNSIYEQINLIVKSAKRNLSQIKKTFVDYFAKEAELKLIELQTPVNFIKDKDGIINGFNKSGNLVLVGDSYGNFTQITYDFNKRISDILEESGKAVRFEYVGDKLSSITDNRGRTVRFTFDGRKLIAVTYPDGEKYDIKYTNDRLRSITNESMQGSLSYDDYGKFEHLTIKSLKPVSSTISDMSVEYYTDNTRIVYCPNRDDYNTKQDYYTFDSAKNVIHLLKVDGAKFSTNISYTYEKNDIGKKITSVTHSKIDNKTIVNVKQYNDIDLLVSQIQDWQKVSDTVKVKTETVYEYDLNNNLISETSTKFTDESGTITPTKYITNYSYNAQGSLVLTESYIEGEELTTGKSYKQTVYDDNGNAIKTISWNSLDSSSKFYSESVLAENGQVIADKDETGEASTEYEYSANSNTVNSVKYPNGSKFAYGRNPNNDLITSVTQSTADGEANQTDIVYEYGLPVKVTSGNTVIDYTYDGKGRKKTVNVNGVLHSEYSYEDYKRDTYDDVLFAKETKILHIDGGSLKSVYLKEGLLDDDVKIMETFESLKIGNVQQYKKYTQSDGNLVEINYIADGENTISYEYDDYHNLLEAVLRHNDTPLLKENYAYNEYGELKEKTVTGEVTHTYGYVYKLNAARDLDYIKFGDYKFKPLTDVNGRNTGKEIYNGSTKLAAEYITYRKVGDHATNMPATVWFGNGSQIKDSIKYKYDKCGNICEITENGHVVAKYAYDSLNRLIREDNKAIGTTTLFTYDNAGNITERCVYAYTRKSGEELSELECTHCTYDYEGDKLVNYNGKKFEYNSLGNPIGEDIAWEYGTRLTKWGDTTFAYDGLGRRISKGNVSFTYDNDGRLIKQSDGLEFIYDASGVIGVRYSTVEDEETVTNDYFYRKDAQGNIIAILDSTGDVVVKYIYDAWGNHAVLDVNGNNVESGIGALNPFRYRGYYYDIETDLYYLQTRYYDPEVGRFISQDNIEYAEHEKINGINLYAYCGNNPVNNVDPTGHAWWHWLIAAVAVVALCALAVGVTVLTGGAGSFAFAVALGALKGAAIGFGVGAVAGTVIGAVAGGIYAANTGTDFWTGVGQGALLGLGIGAFAGAVIGAVIGGISGGMKFNANQLMNSYELPTNPNVDCSEIAEDLLNMNNGKGDILNITSSNSMDFNIVSNGSTQSGMYYHEVYRYGRYIVDPRYGQVVSQGAYMKILKAINYGIKFIINIL